MRLPLALLAALLLAPTADAQTADAPVYPVARGTSLLGGSASLVRSDRTTTAFLAPRVGRFVADGLALSLDLGVTHSRSTFTTLEADGFDLVEVERTFRSTGLGLGPTVAYYLGSPEASVYPFAEAGLSLDYRFSSGFEGADDDSFGVGGEVAAGVMVPVARNVGLRAQVFYQAYDVGGDSDFGDLYGLSAGFTSFLY
jgi:hypothetical protein